MDLLNIMAQRELHFYSPFTSWSPAIEKYLNMKTPDGSKLSLEVRYRIDVGTVEDTLEELFG